MKPLLFLLTRILHANPFFGSPVGQPADIAPYLPPWALFKVIMQESAAAHVPLDIAIRLMYEESGYDGDVINVNMHPDDPTYFSIDRGWLQINSVHWLDGIYANPAQDLSDLRTHLRFGYGLLYGWWKRFGTWKSALTYWNCGLIDPKLVPAKTRAFVFRVLDKS